MRPFLGGKACSFFGTCEELRFIYKNQRGENCEWKEIYHVHKTTQKDDHYKYS